MIRVASLAAALLALAASASAIPVTGILTGSDGNFSYSVVHSSTGGNDGQSGAILDSVTLGGGGGSVSVSGGGTLLDINLQLLVGTSTYNASGQFDLAGLLDDTAQLDQLLGSLTLTYVSGSSSVYNGLTFYMEDRNYSSAALKPNSLNGTTLSLWGATAFTGSVAAIGDSMDLIAGGTGIDLRISLASPIPEPTSAMLYAVAIGVVVAGTRRSRRVGSQASAR